MGDFLWVVVLIVTSSLPGLTRQSILLKKMDARVRPAHDDWYVPFYFFGGLGHGFCGPRKPSNALAMPSTPMSSKRRPTI